MTSWTVQNYECVQFEFAMISRTNERIRAQVAILDKQIGSGLITKVNRSEYVQLELNNVNVNNDELHLTCKMCTPTIYMHSYNLSYRLNE